VRQHLQLLRIALREWPGLVRIVAFSVGFSVAAALEPWPLKILVDYALGGRPLPSWLQWVGRGAAWLVVVAALASLAVFVLQTLLDIGLTRAWAVVGRRLVLNLGAELFGRLQRLSLGFHSRTSTGDTLSRINDDSWCIYTLAEALLVAPAQHTVTLVLLGTVAWSLDPALALVSLLAAPLLAVSASFFGDRLKTRALRHREAQAGVMAFLHQVMGAIPVVQAFGLQDANRRRFSELAEATVVATQREAVWKGLFGSVNGVVVALGTALILFVGGVRVLDGALSLGSLLVFLGYLQALQGASQSLLGIYGTVRAAGASVHRVFEVLGAHDDVVERPAARGLAPVRAHQGRRVRFDAVTFGYLPDAPVLHDVTIDVEAGETLALVGATGAGKSTLASLVPRFYDPWRGRVVVDGTDVRDLQLASLRRNVGLVPQEPLLFPVTIAENIAYGRPDATLDQIVAASRAANADEFVRSFAEGYQTVVGERGASLSGGQRQRIAIARALLKDAPILILDEPTSALDVVSEHAILEALARLFRGRTVLIIAHRLSTIRLADRIAVLDRGRLAELGSQEHLLAAGGLYRRLHDLQFDTKAARVETHELDG
jgi:ATP-binding cassette subfamily B protein/subfamily B ATP-binding cassette protein MsbA